MTHEHNTLGNLRRNDPQAAVVIYKRLRAAGAWRPEWTEYILRLQDRLEPISTMLKLADAELGRHAGKPK